MYTALVPDVESMEGDVPVPGLVMVLLKLPFVMGFGDMGGACGGIGGGCVDGRDLVSMRRARLDDEE